MQRPLLIDRLVLLVDGRLRHGHHFFLRPRYRRAGITWSSALSEPFTCSFDLLRLLSFAQ
jgi:hypothetical protein